MRIGPTTQCCADTPQILMPGQLTAASIAPGKPQYLYSLSPLAERPAGRGSCHGHSPRVRERHLPDAWMVFYGAESADGLRD